MSDDRHTGTRGIEHPGTASRGTTAAPLDYRRPDTSAFASSRRLDDAVRAFRERVNVAELPPEKNLTGSGQFFWGRLVRDAVVLRIKGLVALDPGSEPFAALARRIAELIRVRDDTAPTRLDELARLARGLPVSEPARKAMIALTAPPVGSAPGLENFLWAKLNASRTNRAPEIPDRHLSFRTAWMLSMWDETSCGYHVGKVEERLRLRGGAVRASGAFHQTLAAGPPWATSDRTERDGRLLGEVIRQSSVSTAVAKMKAAIDAGQVLHARVLSGIGYGTGGTPKLILNARGEVLSPQPPHEHSLIVIGHNGMDTFVFHDADATVSHTPELGFGLLFYDSSRGTLGTATSPFGLSVSEDGKHSRGDKRYQVLSIFTFR